MDTVTNASPPASAAGAATPALPPVPRGAWLRGNANLWALAAAILAFKLWLWYSGMPANAEIRPVGELLPISVGKLAAFYNFILGWLGLAALMSAANLNRIFVHFFRPLEIIRNAELREVLMAPAMSIFALLVLLLTLLVWQAIWVVQLQTDYEVIVRLEGSASTGRFVNDEGTAIRSLRLTDGRPVRLALGSLGSASLITVRDKYGLRTLDGFVLRRKLLGYRVEPCALVPPATNDPAGPAGENIRAGPRELHISGPLRWSQARVRTPMTLADGWQSGGGWLRGGDGKDGPERGAPPYAQVYLDQLYAERETFAKWVDAPAYRAESGTVVHQAIKGYDVGIAFDERELTCGAARVPTREAVTLDATQIS